MKNEIEKRINELNDIWTKIIELDDQSIEMDAELKDAFKSNDWKLAYMIGTQLELINSMKRDLIDQSDILDRLITMMLIEE